MCCLVWQVWKVGIKPMFFNTPADLDSPGPCAAKNAASEKHVGKKDFYLDCQPR